MSLPYENATSGQRAIGEMQKILAGFGCQGFGHFTDFEHGELIVQFKWRERQVSVKASFAGYTAAWLKRNPWTPRKYTSKQQWETNARDRASIAVCSVLRDWIKGQVTAVETGILSFEGAFLGQILLSNGETVLDRITSQKLLAPPHETKAPGP